MTSDWSTSLQLAFDKLLGRKRSAKNAASRIKAILVYDRTDLNPAILEKMKEEIIAVIAKYAAVDIDRVAVKMVLDHHAQCLTAEIPLGTVTRRAKRHDTSPA